jgi:hypothetical protein
MGLVLYMTAWGGYTVWVQLSGTPAQVEIEHCHVPLQGSGHYESCTGVWRQTDGTQRTVTVYGSNIAERRTVDVHIRGDTGFTNSFAGWIVLLVGMGLVGLFLFAIWVSRRYRRLRGSQTA